MLYIMCLTAIAATFGLLSPWVYVVVGAIWVLSD